MNAKKIAIPSNAPGGLEGQRSEHFGHCELFTIVTLQGREIVAVDTVAPPPHGPGGCLAPISLLREQGISAIIVGGMGKRPLAGFQEAGIEVYWAPRESSPNVGSVVEGLLENRFHPMVPVQACTGHNCHGH